MAEPTHAELILDQFTRQAGVFNTAATITNADAVRMIVRPPGRDRTIRFSMSPAAAALSCARSRLMSDARPVST